MSHDDGVEEPSTAREDVWATSKKVLSEGGMKSNKSCVIHVIAYDSARVTADSVVLHWMHRGVGRCQQQTSQRSPNQNGICIISVIVTLMN